MSGETALAKYRPSGPQRPCKTGGQGPTKAVLGHPAAVATPSEVERPAVPSFLLSGQRTGLGWRGHDGRASY
jgi:hypothetical protein